VRRGVSWSVLECLGVSWTAPSAYPRRPESPELCYSSGYWVLGGYAVMLRNSVGQGVFGNLSIRYFV
jgi:hypothetical protein